MAWEFPDLQIIAITPDKQDVIEKFMEEKKYTWNNITIITDYQNDYFPILQLNIHPTTVLINKSGIIENIHYGGGIKPIIVDVDKFLSQEVNKE